MEIDDIVMKFIGAIEPVGETHIDDERFENLKELTILIDALLTRVYEIPHYHSDKKEFSIKRSCDYASDFLKKEVELFKED